MRMLMKVGLITVIFLAAGIIITLLKGGENRPGVGGPIGIILIFGMLAGIRAIWKYKPESEQKKDTTADNEALNKRNRS